MVNGVIYMLINNKNKYELDMSPCAIMLIFIALQKWGETRRYLQYDLCKRFAESAAFALPDEGFLPSKPPAVEDILEEFYFPQSPLKPEDLELIKVDFTTDKAHSKAPVRMR